ncbi:hypothetical protein BBP40_011024 [Aspergillus hancockii]|nr:hypothetical protein BBP40_011024 [Aspergillus hancockii]
MEITSHDVISSYFIGPKSENMVDFQNNLNTILEEIVRNRELYQPKDDSPRYQGHMCTDMTMSNLLRYFMTIIYNPNNVTVEATQGSGEEEEDEENDVPLSWGHITCDGTVASLESIWVARNLKFYPLTLRMAMKEGPLGFIDETFRVTTCVGEEKLFKDLGVWELLNLRSDIILDMGDALYRQFGVTSKFLEETLAPFNIQTTGKDVLEHKFRSTKPTKYFLAQTRHYSWPKGGAIAGIGSANMQGVELGMEGRISLHSLERELNRWLEERQAVYAVVAMICIPEGGVDPLYEILAMRRRFQDRGLSFLVHADAAWGGYFTSMIPRNLMQPGRHSKDDDGRTAVGKVPSLALKQNTLKDMIALKGADTITVDPHKAGYISSSPAPPLGLLGCPIRLSASIRADTGVSWLSAYYAAMHYGEHNKDETRKPYYIIVPSNPLPLEKKGYDVLQTSNAQVMEWLRVGSDLNINAFAINWYDSDGNLNTELEEANYLMRRVVNRLSITKSSGQPNGIPLFLTSTQFEPALYGKCAQNFMRRLKLNPCAQGLWVLRNVMMSSFPTDGDFIDKLMQELEKVIIDEVKKCRERNSVTANPIEFLLRGTDEVFLGFHTSFHRATQRQQIILSAEPKSDIKKKYEALKPKFPTQQIWFISNAPEGLEGLIKDIEDPAQERRVVEGQISVRDGAEYRDSIPCSGDDACCEKPANRDDHYPRHSMPFYLYDSGKQHHISHILLQAPNVDISASLILTLTEFREETMHPFPAKNDAPVVTSEAFFFRPDRSFKVKVYEDPKSDSAKGPGLIDELRAPIGCGKMMLQLDVHIDVEALNHDPLESTDLDVAWDAQLDKITDVLNGQ